MRRDEEPSEKTAWNLTKGGVRFARHSCSLIAPQVFAYSATPVRFARDSDPLASAKA